MNINTFSQDFLKIQTYLVALKALLFTLSRGISINVKSVAI